MVSYHSSIPVWSSEHWAPVNWDKQYWALMHNFERSCSDTDVLFIDNTYLNATQVLEAVCNHNKAVIFNLVDPPYTWHYLEQQLSTTGIEIVCVGTDAPDYPVHYWMLWAYDKFPNYHDHDLYFRSTPKCHVFLSYMMGNSHHHRRRLQHWLQERDVVSLGHLTHGQRKSADYTPFAFLGDIDTWQHHFLTIVSETVFRLEPELAITEKIIKPILGLRPFVINGSPRYMQVLESLGFDLFRDIIPIDQMIAPIRDVDACIDRNQNLICDTILQLEKLDLQALYNMLLPRLKKNRDILLYMMRDQYQRLCLNDINLNWRHPVDIYGVSV